MQIEPRPDSKILEGWDQPSPALDVAQKVKVAVVAPEPSASEDTAEMAAKAEAENAAAEKEFKRNLEVSQRTFENAFDISRFAIHLVGF